MHETTRQVRAMYEKYPYPPRHPAEMMDMHPYLALSYLETRLPVEGKLKILDAGCGTGAICLGTALCNPLAHITAVDLNRQALQRIRAESLGLGLQNLQVEEVDLMTLEGLSSPSGGFDVIISSGVLHHLADPQTGLTQLAQHLAPGGVMRVMVYNRFGRQGLTRFVDGLDQLHQSRQELEARLTLGRQVMRGLPEHSPVHAPPFSDGSAAGDEEFVDRYLNLSDRSYSTAEFMHMIEEAGLCFMRWWEPRQWGLEALSSDPTLRRDLAQVPREQVWAAIELLTNQCQMDLYLCRPGAQARAPVDLRGSTVALSPQSSLRTSRRMTGPLLFHYHDEVAVREVAPRFLNDLEKRIIDLASPRPARVEAMLEQLDDPQPQVLQTLDGLLQEEVLYHPLS